MVHDGTSSEPKKHDRSSFARLLLISNLVPLLSEYEISPAMPLPDPTFAAYGQHKVAYYPYGSGSDAVVFIHGWTCDSSLWEPQQSLFEKYQRTVLVDYIGHGNSDAPEIEYSMETLARSVKAALDHADVEKATIVCHSMGGPVTTMLLRLFPDMIEGVIYVDSFFQLPEHYLTHPELAAIRQRNSDDNTFGLWIRAICREPGEATEKIVNRMTSTPKHVRISCTGTEARPHAFRYDEVYDIPALHIGTVFAKMDPFWKHHLPRIELQEEEWRDCKHFPFMEEPERFDKAVEKWIGEKGIM